MKIIAQLKLFHVSQNSHQNLYFLLQFYSLQHNSTSKSQLLTMKQSSFYDTRKKAKQKLCPKILANKKNNELERFVYQESSREKTKQINESV